MKPLHLFIITWYIERFAALHIHAMEATTEYYFLSHWYKRGYVAFTHMENDTEHTSFDATCYTA